MIQLIRDTRLEETQSLDRDSQIVIVPREVFTRRIGSARSFSLRSGIRRELEERLTSRTTANTIPNAFGC